MADSKVEIQVTADTSDAKRSLADLEAAADRAMDSGANSARKLAKSLDEVGESAKVSARQIKGVVAGMAGMATGLASSVLKAQGREKEASYLGGASSGAIQGAGMMAPLGPLAMALGAAGGGIIGAIKTNFEREAAGKAEASAMGDLADALEKAREQMAAAKERADGFAATIERLGDASRTTNAREAERAAEMEKRQNAIADATERMAAAEKALRDQAAAIDGPQTEEQKKAADRIREAWAEANQDLQAATAELDRLKSTKIEAAKAADLKPLDQRGDGPQLSNLEKLGASFGNAADNLAREGNRLAEEQLSVLKDISAKTGAPAAFA
jgi:colicin import membrane protein